MPSLEDMQYAIPRCWRRRIDRSGQHGTHRQCAEPMVFDAEANVWVCPACGGTEAGRAVASRPWVTEIAA